jgi:hypothetical protein
MNGEGGTVIVRKHLQYIKYSNDIKGGIYDPACLTGGQGIKLQSCGITEIGNFTLWPP